jgi:hypothetical protein
MNKKIIFSLILLSFNASIISGEIEKPELQKTKKNEDEEDCSVHYRFLTFNSSKAAVSLATANFWECLKRRDTKRTERERAKADSKPE